MASGVPLFLSILSQSLSRNAVCFLMDLSWDQHRRFFGLFPVISFFRFFSAFENTPTEVERSVLMFLAVIYSPQLQKL